MKITVKISIFIDINYICIGTKLKRKLNCKRSIEWIKFFVSFSNKRKIKSVQNENLLRKCIWIGELKALLIGIFFLQE